MIDRTRWVFAAVAAALLVLGTGAPALAQAANSCTLNYRRGDNMWATAADREHMLPTESITLQPGQKKAFVTDWRYEKVQNDGTTYYGSHGRAHYNVGTRVVKVTYKPDAFSVKTFFLEPGQSTNTGVYIGMYYIGGHAGDIVEVACP